MDPMTLLAVAAFAWCVWRAVQAAGHEVNRAYTANHQARLDDLRASGVRDHPARWMARAGALSATAADFRHLGPGMLRAARQGWAEARDQWGDNRDQHQEWLKARRDAHATRRAQAAGHPKAGAVPAAQQRPAVEARRGATEVNTRPSPRPRSRAGTVFDTRAAVFDGDSRATDGGTPAGGEGDLSDNGDLGTGDYRSGLDDDGDLGDDRNDGPPPPRTWEGHPASGRHAAPLPDVPTREFPWMLSVRSKSGRSLDPFSTSGAATGTVWDADDLARRVAAADLDDDIEIEAWRLGDPDRTPLNLEPFRRRSVADPDPDSTPNVDSDSTSDPDPDPTAGPDPDRADAPVPPAIPTPGDTGAATTNPTDGGTMSSATGEAGKFEAGKAQFQAFMEDAATAVTAADRMAASLQNGGLRDAETIGDVARITAKAQELWSAAQDGLTNFISNHQNVADAVRNAPVEAAETGFYQPA